MSEPTPEQRAALQAEGVSVALVSGAGCGKTRVLSDRYLRAVVGQEGIPLPCVVALTFTEKAARELRDRVRRLSRERLARDPESKLWQAVRRGLEAAPISTFHGFCAQVLRTFPIEAGVEPGFRIVDESLAGVMRRQTVDEALRRRLIEGEPAVQALVLRLGLQETRDLVGELLEQRAGRDYAAWCVQDPDQIAERWRHYVTLQGRPIVSRLVASTAAACWRRIRPEECSNEALRANLEALRTWFERMAGGDLVDLGALVEWCQPPARMRSADWPSEDVKNRVRQAWSKLPKLVAKADRLLRWDAPIARRMAVETWALCRLASDAIERYAARKREQGSLDYDDLQAGVLRLLRDGPNAAVEAIRRGVRLILVDEFQDTDPVQAEILERLAGDELAGGRLFLVGDVKQSIYGFRGAAPELLGAFRERFPAPGRLQLTENFRSTPELIRFANMLFGGVFDRPEDRLRASRAELPRREFPPVTFVSPATPADGSKPSGARRKLAEAVALARLIRSRLEAGWTIADPGNGRPRRAGPGDVVFLLRAHAQAPALERALVEEGFDYHVAGGGTFYSQPEVLDLINLLTAIEDPTDEVALVGLLRSPIFGVSDEALYWLSRSPSGTLAGGLSDASVRAGLMAVDRQRVERAERLLRRWRSRKDRVPIHRLLEGALDESGYEVALLAERHGERMRANCRKLVRVARSFDAFGGLSVADFVERLRADYEDPPRESQEATADELGDAVRIMTIHQAKGLEFPIVVVPSLDREAQRRRDRVSYLDDFGPIVHGVGGEGDEETEDEVGNPIDWFARQWRALGEREEELRIFYVAVTRARDALILSSSRPVDEEVDAPALRLLWERFDTCTGKALEPRPGDPHRDCAGIEVVQVDVTPGPHAGRARSQRPKSRLLWIARELERAIASPAQEAERAESLRGKPRLVDLVAGASSPMGAGLRALLRRVFETSPWVGSDRPDWQAVIERVAPRVVPEPGPRVVMEAARRLGSWSGLIDLTEAEEIRTGLEWQARWRETLFLGRTEWAVRDAAGWHLVHVAEGEGNDEGLASDQLRAVLAVEAVGLTPVVESRLVVLGSTACNEQRWSVRIDPQRIDALWEALRLRSS